MLSAVICFIGATYGLYLGWAASSLKGELKVTNIVEGFIYAGCMGFFLGVSCPVILDAEVRSAWPPCAYAHAAFEGACFSLIGATLGFLFAPEDD